MLFMNQPNFLLVKLFKAELIYTGDIRTITFPQGYAPHYRINFSSKQLATALKQYSNSTKAICCSCWTH